MGGRDQRVDGQQAEGRRAVDDDVLELAVQRGEFVLQLERRVELADQPRFELGQRDAGRRDRQVGLARRQDDVGEVDSLSTKTSYMLFSAARMSMYDMLLLPCGSRSMSSVGLPRMARAAARLMAVVVLPTPPF